MCQAVTVDGQYARQVQELADYLGTKPEALVWRDGHAQPCEGGYLFCLCPINLEATAEKFERDFERDDWSDGVMTKRAAA